jgi:hypothetical protein
MLVPDVPRFMDGHREVRPSPGLVLSDDDYRFCQEFVITAAIRLSEVDFDLDLGALARDHWLRQRNEAGEASSEPPPRLGPLQHPCLVGQIK